MLSSMPLSAAAGKTWALDEICIGQLCSIERFPPPAPAFVIRMLPRTKAARPQTSIF
jgi:hypothetical protein